ncbi:MAG TPA: diacylglycerol kinase family protein [Solirubrobacterales bacterium]|nr:diacylglycerol kinase family protein [Solirubrobacterales bacterium]
MRRRLGAIVAILGGGAAIGLAVYAFVTDFPRGLVVLVCVLGALGAAWMGLLRRGPVRLAGMVVAALLAGIGIGTMLSGDNGWALGAGIVALVASIAGARVAFRPDRSLPPAVPPRHPVLFVNPRSGDGRATRVGLVEAARNLGFETVEMAPGEDLEQLVRAAVERGADGLAMAGGDGSQALVAAIAAEHDLPYACIPSGTRNHFALDLGVDREDVVGSLGAFVDGGERYVDLGEVNGRVFVNNVSLGVYAEAVSQEQYREAKLRTLLDTLAEALGPDGEPNELRWTDHEGKGQSSTALILVSNNVYRLGPTLGSGTRPRLDAGVLGVVDFVPPIAGSKARAARWRELAVEELEVDADHPIPVGIDGEPLVLAPPLHFRIRSKALRVRISHQHPGASPSADVPRGPLSALKGLIRTAIHADSSGA